MRGYRLKEIDWRNKIVEYISAEAELGQQLSDSAKLDKILKLVADFNRRLEILEVALKVRNNMGTYNESELEGDKDKSEEHAGQSNPHEDTGKEDRVIDENVNSTFEDSFRQANTQDGSYAGDDENTEKSGNSDNAEEETPRDKSNTPSQSTPKFNLFSQESQGSGKDKKNSLQKAGSSK
ncbi:hypothetical protein CARUB_v10012778mg [Capsella rubella]|uniref:Uncharacterized protein n=1 Tax=Capsella rubella TaxID=81985 RepID=R0GIT8_9BRAS|nr:hypothetical protein CARUB_v10012778mg [Capsella rubella]